jgi:glycosyltransferase involved in cell wall biosynthesis
VDGASKDEFLGNAAALLFPIRWPEPFGLVMVEAMACGTPVIALRRGSVPEVVEHGVTGFICDDESEMVEAIGRIDEIDRARCRAVAEERFSPDRMAEQYLELYQRLCGNDILSVFDTDHQVAALGGHHDLGRVRGPVVA